MSGFSYPTPFEFGGGGGGGGGGANNDGRPQKSAAPEKRTPGRAKSNDENLFSAGKSVPTPQRRIGPKTKSGRCLPKPAPTLPVRVATTSSGSGHVSSSQRGRAPPTNRGVGKSQSSNLEQMQSGARVRSSSLSKKPGPRKQVQPDDSMESDKKPSSLKNFLGSSSRDKDKRNLGDLQTSLHSAPDPNATRGSSDRQKSGAIKQFLTGSLRRKSKNDDLELMIGDINTSSPEPDDRAESAKSKSTQKGSSRQRRSSEHDDEEHSSKKDKPKSFKQLLGKKQPTAKSKNEDLEPMSKSKSRNGRGRDRDRDTAPGSPASATATDTDSARRPASPERETSLSPEPRKPASLFTNLLDTIYDSYLDPKAQEGSDNDELDNLHKSVSRFDMSISSLF